ncbi:hypothetical protein GW17_00050778 [Ensete ventricosum]|nr:hypothetical protein GW17_00050778 [Ensete ventricosum]
MLWRERSPMPRREERVKTTMTTMATDIDSLPQDLLVEMCVSIVSSSPAPREDIMCLRASRFREVSKGRKVGQCMPMRRERVFRWLNADGYFAFLRSCAECDNLEASLILGLVSSNSPFTSS